MPLYIALGGALGALARYAVQVWALPMSARFPWGTLLVNVTGCLLIGFALRTLDGHQAAGLRAFLGVGVLGGYTTFSTWSWESLALLREGQWGWGAAYAAGTVALCLGAVALGAGAAGLLVRPGG